MTRITREALAKVERAAAAAWPDEACGLLLSRGSVICDAVVSPNRATNPREAFRLDPALHLRTQRAARVKGMAVAGIFHSHPSGDTAPSEADVRAAKEHASLLWLIVAVGGGKAGEARLFRLGKEKKRASGPVLEETRLHFPKTVA